MVTKRALPRMNIYLEDRGLPQRIRVAAARRGVSISDYCEAALLERVTADEIEEARRRVDLVELGHRMDELAARWGSIDVPAVDLVNEGRR